MVAMLQKNVYHALITLDQPLTRRIHIQWRLAPWDYGILGSDNGGIFSLNAKHKPELL